MEDPQAVEPGGSRTGAPALQKLHPLRLEEPPREPGRGENGDRDEKPGHLEAVSTAPAASPDRLDRDNVALELQLRVLEPGRDADELRGEEAAEALAGLRLELRLPGVEGERARRHHRVRTGIDRLADRLHELAERRLLARPPMYAAALDRVVDRLAAAGLDDRLERMRPVGVVDAEELDGRRIWQP